MSHFALGLLTLRLCSIFGIRAFGSKRPGSFSLRCLHVVEISVMSRWRCLRNKFLTASLVMFHLERRTR